MALNCYSFFSSENRRFVYAFQVTDVQTNRQTGRQTDGQHRHVKLRRRRERQLNNTAGINAAAVVTGFIYDELQRSYVLSTVHCRSAFHLYPARLFLTLH